MKKAITVMAGMVLAAGVIQLPPVKEKCMETISRITMSGWKEIKPYTYIAGLKETGKGNTVDEKKAYCLMYDSSYADTTKYRIMYTENGGESWNEGNIVTEEGKTKRFSLEDGRMITFSINRGSSIPALNVYSLSENGLETEISNDREFLDVSEELKNMNLKFEAEYLGGYRFRFRFRNREDGEVVYDREMELDPETFREKKISG